MKIVRLIVISLLMFSLLMSIYWIIEIKHINDLYDYHNLIIPFSSRLYFLIIPTLFIVFWLLKEEDNLLDLIPIIGVGIYVILGIIDLIGICISNTSSYSFVYVNVILDCLIGLFLIEIIFIFTFIISGKNHKLFDFNVGRKEFIIYIYIPIVICFIFQRLITFFFKSYFYDTSIEDLFIALLLLTFLIIECALRFSSTIVHIMNLLCNLGIIIYCVILLFNVSGNVFNNPAVYNYAFFLALFMVCSIMMLVFHLQDERETINV